MESDCIRLCQRLRMEYTQWNGCARHLFLLIELEGTGLQLLEGTMRHLIMKRVDGNTDSWPLGVLFSYYWATTLDFNRAGSASHLALSATPTVRPDRVSDRFRFPTRRRRRPKYSTTVFKLTPEADHWRIVGRDRERERERPLDVCTIRIASVPASFHAFGLSACRNGNAISDICFSDPLSVVINFQTKDHLHRSL